VHRRDLSVDPRVSLALRRRRGRPVPPDELAASLEMTPAKLADATAALSAAGFVVELHPMLGLRLVEPPPALRAEEIAWNLRTGRVGRRVRCVGTAASTNDLAWDAAARGRDEADGLTVFAEYQSEGRGRRGSRWLAPPHTSLLCSVVLWVAPVSEGDSMWRAATCSAALTRGAAVAAAEAIEQQCDLSVGIKWPNDIIVEDRKVGGILVEARPGTGAASPVVLGIGLNCRQRPEAFSPDIRESVASLTMCGAEVDRTLLARALLERLDRTCTGEGGNERAEEVRREAARRCCTLGRRLTLLEGDATYCGEVVDLDADYGLVLRLADGGLRRFPAMTAHVVGGGGLAGPEKST